MSRRRRTEDWRREGEEERPKREEPRSTGDFERALGEEVSVSAEFDLPLCVLVARGEHHGWSPEAALQVVSVLRAGDLVAQPEPAEITVALPNTEYGDAETMVPRLRKTLPGATIGIAVHTAGDTVSDLLNRARAVTGRA